MAARAVAADARQRNEKRAAEAEKARRRLKRRRKNPQTTARDERQLPERETEQVPGKRTRDAQINSQKKNSGFQ